MKSFKFNLSLIFLALVNLPLILYAQDVNSREYFPLKEGNTWVYEVKEGDELSIEKVMIETKEDVGNVEKVKFIHYTDGEKKSYDYIRRYPEGIKLYRKVDIDDDCYESYTPFKMILPFNIDPTKKYESSNSVWDNEGKKLTGASGKTTLEIKFEGEEDVTVPAGKFLNCIKISKSSFRSDNNGGFEKETSTIWFARNVGKVREIQERFTYNVGKNVTDVETAVLELKEAIVDGVKY